MSQAVFLPDNKAGWIPFALASGLGFLAREPFDLIYSTAPPFSSHLVGALLKRFSRKPLVLDFRDPWTDNQFARYPTPAHLALHRALERATLRAADAVVSINDRITETLAGKYPRIAPGKFLTIPHGFDPEDFAEGGTATGRSSPLCPPDGEYGSVGVWECESDPHTPILPYSHTVCSPTLPLHPSPPTHPFTITYSGAFYERTTPRYFLLALRGLLDGHPELAKEIKAVFVGLFRAENERLVRDLGLDGVVEVTGYVDHARSVRRIKEADLLWLMIGDGPGNAVISTGKLFEYIGTGRPILACVPEGAAAQTVRAMGNGMVVPPDDVGAIQRAIWEYYGRYRAGTLRPTDPAVITQYDRRRLTGRLAEVFDRAARKEGAGKT